MLVALLVALLGPPGWRFVDESHADGRSLNPARTVELADAPAWPAHPDDASPPGSRYGSLSVGPGGGTRVPLVWHAATDALWLDADRDGRFAPGERVTLSGVHTAPVTLPLPGGVTATRMVTVRKRGGGLAWSVRGYTEGTVVVGGRSVAARLTDGDADGGFDSPAEQFPVGTPVTVSGSTVLLKPRPDGLGLTARERPTETGEVVVSVSRLPQSEVAGLAADYVSEFGELVTVTAEGAKALPAGRYRLDSLALRLADADGAVWTYHFHAPDRSKFPVVVTPGGRTPQVLPGDLGVTIGSPTGRGPATRCGSARPSCRATWR